MPPAIHFLKHLNPKQRSLPQPMRMSQRVQKTTIAVCAALPEFFDSEEVELCPMKSNWHMTLRSAVAF